jgi:hypothetical protein
LRRDEARRLSGFAVSAVLACGQEIADAMSNEARAQAATPDGRPPFTATLSNHFPLVFGMDVSDVSAALRRPLQYVSGPPGSEIYLAPRNQGGSGLINHHDRLFLQFRNGRLAGWKEDYGSD